MSQSANSKHVVVAGVGPYVFDTGPTFLLLKAILEEVFREAGFKNLLSRAHGVPFVSANLEV